MLLSVIETAETLGCSAQYVRKLLREGRLAGQKIGDSWIINDDTLESFDRKDLRMKKNDVPDRKSKKAPKQDALNCLSFFSGAMGLDIGLEQEGINILLACETDNACRRTIVANEPGIGLIGDMLLPVDLPLGLGVLFEHPVRGDDEDRGGGFEAYAALDADDRVADVHVAADAPLNGRSGICRTFCTCTAS